MKGLSIIPAHVVEITTPKRYLLNGLWLGPRRARRCVVWVHGLGSSLFSKLGIAKRLVDARTAVLAFNNRGHDVIARVRRRGGKALCAGAARERFADCVDDVQGAVNFARRAGAKDIYLAGHSTGSQKSAYWARKKKSRGVRGIILLAPISDYASAARLRGKKKVARAAKAARALLSRGKKRALIPSALWPDVVGARRFLSLYSGKGAEEIFTYWDRKRRPATLRAIRKPVLVLLAGRDEYADRPAKEIARWFSKHLQTGRAIVVPRVKHGFRGGEMYVASEVRRWMTSTR